MCSSPALPSSALGMNEVENFERAAAAVRGERTRKSSTNSNNLGGQIAWRIQFLLCSSHLDQTDQRLGKGHQLVAFDISFVVVFVHSSQ